MKKRIMAALFAMIMLAGCTKSNPPSETELRVTVPYTGKSDFILLQAGGCTVVNDAAYNETYPTVEAVLKNSNAQKIDLLIISHYDKDHIGGAADILRNFDVKNIVMPDYFSGSEYWLEMMSVLRESETRQYVISEEMHFSFGGMEIRISTPEKNDYDDDNDYSLITDVTYRNTRLLLTGDACETRLSEFLSILPEDTRYDMIKLPHHGDCCDALTELVKLTKPQYAIITADASHETVDRKTLKILKKTDTVVLFSDKDTVTIVSDGEKLINDS